ncbi:MAG: tRNA (adenosine(37)-N6)-dimethylallyltransferase MiaA [Ferruginibacter sp.]
MEHLSNNPLLYNKTCIIIAGATAVGKTAVAIELAKYFSTQIISADSRQCYQELNIGVARPSIDELNAVPHYFINSHSIETTVNAAIFEQYALQKLSDIFLQKDVAIVVGGTGLYIKTLCEGIDPIPAIEASIRGKIIEAYTINGLAWLQNQVQKEDPEFYADGEIQNPQRLMRALEIVRATGKSIRYFQQNQKVNRPFNIIKIGLELPREILYERINSRVDMMMKAGLLEEVKSLVDFQQFNALQTVGYNELFDFINGNCNEDEAINLIKQNTRHYAKRQMTWFKKDKTISWCIPKQEAVLALPVMNELLK